MKKRYQRWGAAFGMMLCILAGSVGITGLHTQAAAEEPRAWLSAYCDGRTTNLNTKEMLKVETSGFAPDAELYYDYSGLKVPGSVDAGTTPVRHDPGGDPIASGDCYVVLGAGNTSGTITVRDGNEASATYNKTASFSFKNIKSGSMEDVFQHAGLVTYTGRAASAKTSNIAWIMDENGFAQTYATRFTVEKVELVPGQSDITPELTDIKENRTNDKWFGVASQKGGEATLKVTDLYSYAHTDAGGLFSHGNKKYTGNISIFFLDKFVVTPRNADKLVVTKTQKNVTYTINGVSQLCTEDGQELIFTGLAPGCTYQVEARITGRSGRTGTITQLGQTNKDVTVNYDRNGHGGEAPESVSGTFTYSSMEDPDSWSHIYLTEPEAPTEPGYVFEGWYLDKACEGKKWDFADDVWGNMTLYAKWTEIPNTVRLGLRLDEDLWSGQTVELYYRSRKMYTLEEKGTVGGYILYENTAVYNGTYDIWLNGEKTTEKVTIHCTGTTFEEAVVYERNMDYYSPRVTTTVNEKISDKPGTITLKYNGKTCYTAENTKGITTIKILNLGEGTEYNIYMDGRDTGKTLKAALNETAQVDFYEAKLTLHYQGDAPWTSAIVRLCDDYGVARYTLKYQKTLADTTEGIHDTVYTGLVQRDEKTEPTPWKVRVGVRYINKYVRSVSGASNYEVEANFYQATATVKLDDAPAKAESIVMTNGTEQYQFETTDKEGSYVVKYALADDSEGAEKAYEVAMEHDGSKQKVTLNMENPHADLEYYTVSYLYKSGTDWNQYKQQKVRKNDTPQEVAPMKLGGVTFRDWSANEDGTNPFDFNAPITNKTMAYTKAGDPKAQINGYVRCDADGTENANGEYYFMPNFSVTGYPTTMDMTFVTLKAENCDKIWIDPEKLQELCKKTQPGADENGVFTFNTDDASITLQFDKDAKVTMADVQALIREDTVVKVKDQTQKHTMQITVYGNTY